MKDQMTDIKKKLEAVAYDPVKGMFVVNLSDALRIAEEQRELLKKYMLRVMKREGTFCIDDNDEGYAQLETIRLELIKEGLK